MMRLPKFTYRVAKKVADAVKMMADAGPETMFVAGGTDLYPNMKRRQQTPKTVISIAGIQGLHEIREGRDSGLVVGACVRLSEIADSKLLTRTQPAVARASGLIATPLLRNMGTIGGNLLLDTRKELTVGDLTE